MWKRELVSLILEKNGEQSDVSRHFNKQLSSKSARQKMILFALLVTGLFPTSEATGHIEVWFLRYSDTCSEHWSTNPCDPMFAFCLSTPQTGRLHVDNCDYASTGQSNGHFHNTNNIDMENMPNIKGHPNPWIVRVDRFLGPLVMLVIKATDVDLFSTEEMHTWGKVLNETIWPRPEQAVWAERVMSDNSHTMRFRVRMYCDANYYTTSCEVLCVADNSSSGHYRCEPGTGRKLCLPGWQGAQCTEDIDECALSFCHVGQCSNLPGDYTCSCPHGYTGKKCSVMTNPCVPNLCQNGGVCANHTSQHAYVCTCAEGWEGVTCNTSRDACQSQPCLNNGSCSNSQNGTGYNCTCLHPHSGDVCQVSEPDVRPIANRTSVETTSAFPPTLEAFTYAVDNSTSAVDSSTTAVDSSTSVVENSTSTVKNSTSSLGNATTTEKFPADDVTTSGHEQPGAGTTSTKDSGDLEKVPSTTPGKSGANEELVSRQEEESHFEPWYIAIVVLVLAMVLGVVLVVILRRRRRHWKRHISPPLTASVSFNGTELSFDNGVYTEVNRTNAQTERQARELPAVPPAGTTPSEDDRFNPTKPTPFVDADGPGATGNHNSSQSEQKNKAAHLLTLTPHLQPSSERAEDNNYADFQSLTDGHRIPRKLSSQEEHHYDGLHELVASMPSASEADKYSDLTFNLDPQAAPVVTICPSPYDTPSNNASYYSTPPTRSPMPQLEPSKPNSTALLRGSDEIEFNNSVLIADWPKSQTHATPATNDSDTDSTDDDDDLQEDLARLRQDVKNKM